MKTAFITHPACLQHAMFAGHPEVPERLSAIDDQLIASGIDGLFYHYEAPCVTREQLLRVHEAAHIDRIEALAPVTGLAEIDADTLMCPHTLEAARRAAGAVVLATELVLAGEVGNAFCSVRPPGHHAERGRAMGFCFFNNVAVGVAHALAAGGLERVAVIDFDVHHGNGTEAIFEGDPRVLLCSSFQHPFYPYTEISTAANIISTPLAAGASGRQFRAAVEAHWLPALAAFAPQMIFISAGFDAHHEDDISDLHLMEADYAWVTRAIKGLATRYAEGRIVSVLEGGYELHALGRSVATHLKALLDG